MPKEEKDLMLTRSMAISDTVNIEERSMLCTAATECRVERYFYKEDEYVDEIIPTDSWQDVKKVPLLDNHSRFSTSSLIGSALEFKKTENTLDCKIVFSKTAENEFIKCQEKHLDSVSVGYQVVNYVYVKKGESVKLFGKEYKAENRSLLISTKTILRELSLVCIPADDDAKIREDVYKLSVRMETEKNPKLEEKMAEEVKNEERAEVNEIEIREAAINAERSRISDIENSCDELGLSNEFKRGLIDNGTSIEDASKLMLKEVAKTRKSSNVIITKDTSDNIREGLGIVAKRNFNVSLTDEEKRSIAKSQFHGVHGPVGVAKAILENNGTRTAFMSNADVYEAIRLQGVEDFDYVTASAGTASMVDIFEQNILTVREWTDERSVSDFNIHNDFDITPIGVIPVVEDKAGITLATIGEHAESIQLGTRAILAQISRQAFINDSFGAFQDMANAYGQACAQTEEYGVYSKLVANGNMKDGYALFSSQHKNDGILALSSTNLSIVKASMLKRVYGGKVVGAPARFLIVSPDLEDTALKLTNSAVDVGSAGDFNPHKNLHVIVSPYLTGATWYLAGSKGKTVTRIYLNGNASPEFVVENSRGTEALGFNYRVVFDYATGVRSPLYLERNVIGEEDSEEYSGSSDSGSSD